MPEENQQTEPTRGSHKLRTALWLVALLIVIAGVAGGLYIYFVVSRGPVPGNIQKSVSFKVYYPQDKKMPAGYHLNKVSFRQAQPGVILFSVSYDNGRSMVFSEEAKPSSDIIDKFNSTAIPVHTSVNTAYGQALIGAYGSGKSLQTVASLPINNGPWLIITAPSDVNQEDLGQAIRSLAK